MAEAGGAIRANGSLAALADSRVQDPETASRAVKEDPGDAAFGAASEVTPKVVSRPTLLPDGPAWCEDRRLN